MFVTRVVTASYKHKMEVKTLVTNTKSSSIQPEVYSTRRMGCLQASMVISGMTSGPTHRCLY